ncbi:MAG: hypothetical protein RI907_928 [Pseudomonadota bacterium]
MSPATTSDTLYAAALLQAVEAAGEDVLTLCEGLSGEELRRSRLTRLKLVQLLQAMSQSLLGVPPSARTDMPEIDWEGWLALPRALTDPDLNQAHEALLMGTQALVPATLMWFRVYRPQSPQWFEAPLPH